MGKQVKNRVLITGFKPFKNIKINTSEILVKEFEKCSFSNFILETAVLPVSFKLAPEKLLRKIEVFKPDVIIMTGIATGIKTIELEKVALNICKKGRQKDLLISENGPVAYFTNYPVLQIEKKLLKKGIPTSISYTAGQYVCNYLYYKIAHFLNNSRSRTLFGFIHLPCQPEESKLHGDGTFIGMDIKVITEGIEIVISELDKVKSLN